MKLCHIDLETTGTNPQVHGVCQIAMILEVDGQDVATWSRHIQPFPQDEIDGEALAVTGLTTRKLAGFDHPTQVYGEFTALLSGHLSGSRGDVWTPAGFNVSFDIDFLIQWMRKCSNNKFSFWNHFTPYGVDPLRFLYILRALGIFQLEKYKLANVCQAFGVELSNAHDALADIRATRTITNRLLSKLAALYGKE